MGSASARLRTRHQDRSANLSIGLTGRAFGVGWRAGVQYLGRYGSVLPVPEFRSSVRRIQKGNDVGGLRVNSARAATAIWSVPPEWHIGRGWFLQAEVGLGYYGVSNEVKA